MYPKKNKKRMEKSGKITPTLSLPALFLLLS